MIVDKDEWEKNEEYMAEYPWNHLGDYPRNLVHRVITIPRIYHGQMIEVDTIITKPDLYSDFSGTLFSVRNSKVNEKYIGPEDVYNYAFYENGRLLTLDEILNKLPLNFEGSVYYKSKYGNSYKDIKNEN